MTPLDTGALDDALVRAGSLVFSETPELDDEALDQQARAHVLHAAFAAIVEARFGATRAGPFLDAHVAASRLAHRCRPHLAELAQVLLASQAPAATLDDDWLGALHESRLDVRLERGPRGIGLAPSSERARRGAHYTPRALVRFMVAESLGRWLWQGPVPSARERLDAQAMRSRAWRETAALDELRVLDPACGGGAFLLEALDVLVDYHLERARVFPESRDERHLAGTPDPVSPSPAKRGRAGVGVASRGEKDVAAQDVAAEGAAAEGLGAKAVAADDVHAITHLRRALAQRHLFGVDLDPGALEAARLSLTLRVLGSPTDGDHAGLLDTRGLPDLSRNLVCADALDASLGQHLPDASPGVGFDVVVGNPPYVPGERLSPATRRLLPGFELGRSGQADLWRLFYERTVRDLLRPGGAHAFVVPDALLARDEHALVRGFLARHLAVTGVCHVGRAFVRAGSNVPVGVSAVVVVGSKRAPGPRESCWIQEWQGERAGPARAVRLRELVHADGRPWRVHAPLAWRALAATLRAGVSLGTLLEPGPLGITRGEELGKSSLARCPVRGRPSRGRVAIVAGGDVERHRVHPARAQVATRALEKPLAYFAGPRVLLVKTGAGPVAAASEDSTPVLQSVYVLHLAGAVRARVSEDAVAGVLSSALVTAFVFYEWTSGKRTQPQLTIGEVKALPFPDPAKTPPLLWRKLGARVARVRALLESGAPAAHVAREERALDGLVATLYGLDLDACLALLEPALDGLPRSQRPRWFRPT